MPDADNGLVMDLRPGAKRPPAMGCRGMVSAPHPLAALAGVDVLARGGTAADAAVAMAATLAVVYPHMTGIGGDAFWIYFDAASGATRCYTGSGAAAQLADLHFYRARGLVAIPERGPLAALTVPGAVDAWFAIHQRSGKLELDSLLAPAIRYARDGVPISRSVALSLVEEYEWLRADDSARVVFLAAGSQSHRHVGDILFQPALARTLEMIARDGRGWFYQGEGAALLEGWAKGSESPLRAADLASHDGIGCEPIEAAFAGLRSITTPPNSQGFTLLLTQAIYENFLRDQRVEDVSPALIHAAVEASKLAYAERDRYLGDPRSHPLPLEVLSADYARLQAERIDPYRAAEIASAASASAAGDTAYFACVDGEGNAVSYIQSLYYRFGACTLVPELGVLLQNRGIAFSLDAGRPTSLVPGRLPRHTLMPAMLLDEEGRPRVVYGSRGGDAQPQIALALSIRMAQLGHDAQRAVEEPRWRLVRRSNSPWEVILERRAGPACIAGLQARGHKVVVGPEWDELMGHAGAIVVDRKRGVLLGGADPRGDGIALGI